MTDIKVFVYMPARNEECNLPACLDALLGQTLKPAKILVINDGSTDNTQKIIKQYGVDVISLPYHAESYTSNIWTTWKIGQLVNYAFPIPQGMEYFLAMAPDVILPLDYIEKLVHIMEANPRLVIASGCIEGEFNLRSHVRGAGRLVKTWFWNRYIREYPENFIRESYPLYKALSLGLEVQSFPELKMKTCRPTHIYKPYYGHAMREFGYFPPFAIMKCLLALFASRKNGLSMLQTYLTSPLKPADKEIHNFILRHQIHRILHFKESLKIWLGRFKGNLGNTRLF